MAKKILVVAAHPDDEILGPGGTLLKHAALGDEVHACIVTVSYAPQWDDAYRKTKRKEAEAVDRLTGIASRTCLDLPTVKLNTVPSGELNAKIAGVIREIRPDIVYTHWEHDINGDHRVIFDGVMTATRPVDTRIEVRCFETLSSSEWNSRAFCPNLYVDIEAYLDTKVKAFLLYESEVKQFPHPRSDRGIRVKAEQRGMEICCPAAEAFIVVRSYA